VDDSKHRIKGILAGMLLGDGCIGMTKSTCYFRMTHTEKQREYLMHKVKLLEELTLVKIHENPPRGKKHPNVEIMATSRTHPLYKRLREIFYVEGKRTITPTILSWLTVEGLALWYMDDGSTTSNYSCYIATHAFPLVQVEVIVDFLYTRFGLKFTILTDRDKYKITITKSECVKFFDMIRPYIVPSMSYKLDYKAMKLLRMKGTVKGEEPVRP